MIADSLPGSNEVREIVTPAAQELDSLKVGLDADAEVMRSDQDAHVTVHLAHAYLIGDRFTVADLNVSAMFFGPVSSPLSLGTFP